MTRLAVLLFLAAFAAESSAQEAPGAAARVEWPTWGGDPGSMHYSPLAQVNRENVANLKFAWEWDTGEGPLSGPRLPVPDNPVRPGSFENTPVVRDGVMYVSTSYNKVVALNPDTGEVEWTYDPRITEWGQVPNGTGFVHRGVALWENENGDRRVFLNSRWRLISIDTVTGEPDPSFGDGGEIDLTAQLLWPINRLHYTQTSPPVVFEDLVILGNGVWDRFVYERDPPGNIQAFSTRTGELVWSFNLIPQPGEFGNDTWEDGSWDRVGHTNVWAPMSLDAERGLIYLPVGTPSNDYYGGMRLGDNLYAEAIVCLDASTGERVWHFQTVRHGLWDYDLPAPPTLLTINVDGREIDAVAAPAKTGFVYVFDRVTGEPVWPIEDRAVPASDVPGERTAATQPFPTRPAPFAKQGFTEEDVIAFTPELREEALEIVRKYRMGGLYNPPSIEGTIASPGILGGANWGGAAADPETGVIYIKANEFPALLAITEANPDQNEGPYGLEPGTPVAEPPERAADQQAAIRHDHRDRSEHRGAPLPGPRGQQPARPRSPGARGRRNRGRATRDRGRPGTHGHRGRARLLHGRRRPPLRHRQDHRRGTVGPPARSQFLREPHDLRIPRRSPVRGDRRGARHRQQTGRVLARRAGRRR